MFGNGYKTKAEAIDAEAARRLDEQQKQELLPKTLAMLLEEFFKQHVDQKLAPKTIERYHDQAAYLDPVLLQMPLTQITPLHLSREWSRLLQCGVHTRKGTPSPMSAKMVRNIAGVISSAFARGIRWGLIAVNPVTNSELPRVKKQGAIALAPAQEALLLAAAAGPWCIRTYLEVDAATGCRRGELLALRWSDIVGDRAILLDRFHKRVKDCGSREPKRRSLGPFAASVRRSGTRDAS